MWNRKQQPPRTLYGVPSDPWSMVTTPFIINDRYLSTAKGKRRRPRKGPCLSRGWRVGMPELKIVDDGPVYTVWEGRSYSTHAEAVAALDYRLTLFKLAVDYYNLHGDKP